ncbi:MAG: hypothetical protein MUW56_19215 [Chryseobacterium sp.]|uniref:hypothetical protein n=1 Tax=Chryseobacterium sp. TaxID=1871047 RepID=UPI0025C561FB|nr:hypothetical protein [Chryseobacterium sp.]MCJ7935692.1 hypothetical protein [Chryseobacterium sp.]
MSQINTDDAHTSTGSAKNRTLLPFPDSSGTSGNPGRTAPPGIQGENKTKSQEYRGGYS